MGDMGSIQVESKLGRCICDAQRFKVNRRTWSWNRLDRNGLGVVRDGRL